MDLVFARRRLQEPEVTKAGAGVQRVRHTGRQKKELHRKRGYQGPRPRRNLSAAVTRPTMVRDPCAFLPLMLGWLVLPIFAPEGPVSQDQRAIGTDLHRSSMTRRQMLRVGLSLAALPLFAACGQSAAPAPTSAPAKPAEAATPTEAA